MDTLKYMQRPFQNYSFPTLEAYEKGEADLIIYAMESGQGHVLASEDLATGAREATADLDTSSGIVHVRLSYRP